MESTMKYLILTALWISYCAAHSALLSITIKEFMERRLGRRYRFYRAAFNLVSLAGLVPLILYSRSAEERIIFTWNGDLLYLRWALYATGLCIVVAGFRHYSFLNFLGIRQITKKDRGGGILMNESGTLDTTGIMGLVRHPVYAGFIILLWAQDLDATRILVSAVLTGYFYLGTILEERKLMLEFGDSYGQYRESVSMFFPAKFIVGRLRAFRSRTGGISESRIGGIAGMPGRGATLHAGDAPVRKRPAGV
jgi:methanethiol S-methyltransferase